MVKIDSSDYHDYVIKNGKLIGEFEQMYQKSENIPWHQNSQQNWLDIRLTVELLKEYCPFNVILDFGSGYGYFLHQISETCGSCSPVLYGYELSNTACKRGKSVFPDINFSQFDLMAVYSDSELKKFKIPQRKEQKILFMLRGTLWYVFPEIDRVVKNISRVTPTGAFFLVSQNFPPLCSDFVGKNVIPNPQAILDLFSNILKPIKSLWLEDNISNGNDNWFMSIMQRL